MPYHVVALTRQQVTAGGLRVLDILYETIIAHMVEMTQHIGEIRARNQREEVEVLTLNPLHPQFYEARQRYGRDTFTVLFLNDAARHACEMYNIEVHYTAEVEENQLPNNLGVVLRMDHYYAG